MSFIRWKAGLLLLKASQRAAQCDSHFTAALFSPWPCALFNVFACQNFSFFFKSVIVSFTVCPLQNFPSFRTSGGGTAPSRSPVAFCGGRRTEKLITLTLSHKWQKVNHCICSHARLQWCTAVWGTADNQPESIEPGAGAASHTLLLQKERGALTSEFTVCASAFRRLAFCRRRSDLMKPVMQEKETLCLLKSWPVWH